MSNDEKKAKLFRYQWLDAVISVYGPAPLTRFVLMTLGSHMDQDGKSCFPSTRLVAQETGLSRRTVETHLRNADEQGWIRREQKGFSGQGWKRHGYTPTIPQAVKEALLRKERGEAPSPPLPEDKRGESQDGRGESDAQRGESHAEGGEPLSPKYSIEVPIEVPIEKPISLNTHSATEPRSVQSRDEFWFAVEARDAAALLKATNGQLFGFGPAKAEWVVGLADCLVEYLENHGREVAAAGVDRTGSEAEVIADAIRDMCRKGHAGKWNLQWFNSFLFASAQIRTGIESMA